MKDRPKGRKHIFIPDLQIKPGVPMDHLTWIGNYIAEKRPDSLIQIGDFADMPSLSSYDEGTKAFEGRKYVADIEVANTGLSMLMAPIDKELARIKRRKLKRWSMRKDLTLGNHEYRILRAINKDRKLEGLIHPTDLRFKEFGFNVHPFLQQVVIDGIAYCHYFVSGQMGHPITTARSLINKQHMSCAAGHQQGRDIAYARRGDGKRMTAIIAGSCYQHDEEYLNPQSNDVWRGLFVFHEVEDGSFDEMLVSLQYLKDNYS